VLSKTRSYAALKRGIEGVRGSAGRPRPTTQSNLLSAEVDTVLDHTVGPQAYHRDEKLRTNIVAHFRFNLARMVDIARSAGAEVMLVTPAVNLRTCAPFKSEHRAGITAAAVAEWQKLVRHATQQHRTTNWAEAVSALQQAVRIDPQFADGHYLLGHALWELKRFDEARAAFVRALDEDVCPLRALPEMIETVRNVAAQRSTVLLDFVKLIEDKSSHRAPGDNWFLDHVHPTIEGHRVLALALIEKMAERGWLRVSPNWNTAVQQEIKRAVESTLAPKDHGVALCTLAKVIAWAGKDAEAHRLALRARSLAPAEATVHFEVGKNAARIGRKDEAVAALREAVSLQPNFAEAKCLLGSVLIDSGETNEALRLGREAVELRPDDARLRLVAAGLFSRGKQLDEAIGACQEALRLNPNYAEAHNTLGWLLKDRGNFSDALTHFREAIRVRPGLTPAMMGVAWMLATHPDASARDPREAVRLSERLAELSRFQNWMALDTLAAAYAAAGRLPEAVRTQRKAVDLARAANSAEIPAVEGRLTLYEKGKAFVEGGP
jgi:tetratricopeptide (TPR) repeat protein